MQLLKVVWSGARGEDRCIPTRTPKACKRRLQLTMSRSVGLTAAVGVHRVLEQPSGPLPPLAGVVRPTERSVWEYCLPPLEKERTRSLFIKPIYLFTLGFMLRVLLPKKTSAWLAVYTVGRRQDGAGICAARRRATCTR